MQIAIISIPTLSNKENITNGSLASALIVKAFQDAAFIPNNATNGEVITVEKVIEILQDAKN